MTTFLLVTWFTATGYVKTDITPMPNRVTCDRVAEYMMSNRTVPSKFLGMDGEMEVKPRYAECKDF